MSDEAIFSAKAKRTIIMALRDLISLYSRPTDRVKSEDEIISTEEQIRYVWSLLDWIHSMPTKTAQPIDDAQFS